jgi:hypothetical protein
MISASPFFIFMAIIWENGFKGESVIAAAPIENPPSLPLEEKEETKSLASKDYKEPKSQSR